VCFDASKEATHACDDVESGVEGLDIGERVGIPWLGYTCGVCLYCRTQRENLCDRPFFTGYTRDGGFATAALADARYAFSLGEKGTDTALAPLLCAGGFGSERTDPACGA
jgi:propanol-preferring alcohol dehydrogenase